MARRDAAGTVRRRDGFRSKHFIFSRAAYGKRSNGLCPHCPALSLGRQSVVIAIEECACKVIADDALSVCCSRSPSTFTPLFRRVQCRNSVCQSNSALRGARSQRSPRNRGPDLGRFRSPPRLRRCKGSGKSGRGRSSPGGRRPPGRACHRLNRAVKGAPNSQVSPSCTARQKMPTSSTPSGALIWIKGTAALEVDACLIEEALGNVSPRGCDRPSACGVHRRLT